MREGEKRSGVKKNGAEEGEKRQRGTPRDKRE